MGIGNRASYWFIYRRGGDGGKGENFDPKIIKIFYDI